MGKITKSSKKVTIAPSSPPNRSSLSTENATIEVKKNFLPGGDIDATLFTRQSWVRQVDTVHHRRRGILITHDTYNHFRLSFDDDKSARSFLGELLVNVSTSDDVVSLSELQLEKVNCQWDDTPRVINPGSAPVDLPLIMSAKMVYSLSTKWEIVKTFYYIALSQTMLDELCEEAICKTPLNGLERADWLPKTEDLSDIRQPKLSVKSEVTKALRSASYETQRDEPPICALVERLISMTKVGRRERSEPFLNISEACVPRLLPRESMENISEAIMFVHIEKIDLTKYDPKKPQKPTFHGMRAFLFRRPVGTISKSHLDKELAKSLQKSRAVDRFLDRGNGSGWTKLEGNEKQLLYCANTCYHGFSVAHTAKCSTRGLVDSMLTTNGTRHY